MGKSEKSSPSDSPGMQAFPAISAGQKQSGRNRGRRNYDLKRDQYKKYPASAISDPHCRAFDFTLRFRRSAAVLSPMSAPVKAACFSCMAPGYIAPDTTDPRAMYKISHTRYPPPDCGNGKTPENGKGKPVPVPCSRRDADQCSAAPEPEIRGSPCEGFPVPERPFRFRRERRNIPVPAEGNPQAVSGRKKPFTRERAPH